MENFFRKENSDLHGGAPRSLLECDDIAASPCGVFGAIAVNGRVLVFALGDQTLLPLSIEGCYTCVKFFYRGTSLLVAGPDGAAVVDISTKKVARVAHDRRYTMAEIPSNDYCFAVVGGASRGNPFH